MKWMVSKLISKNPRMNEEFLQETIPDAKIGKLSDWISEAFPIPASRVSKIDLSGLWLVPGQITASSLAQILIKEWNIQRIWFHSLALINATHTTNKISRLLHLEAFISHF